MANRGPDGPDEDATGGRADQDTSGGADDAAYPEAEVRRTSVRERLGTGDPAGEARPGGDQDRGSGDSGSADSGSADIAQDGEEPGIEEPGIEEPAAPTADTPALDDHEGSDATTVSQGPAESTT